MMFNFRILFWSVVRFSPRRSAAPPQNGPLGNTCARQFVIVTDPCRCETYLFVRRPR